MPSSSSTHDDGFGDVSYSTPSASDYPRANGYPDPGYPNSAYGNASYQPAAYQAPRGSAVAAPAGTYAPTNHRPAATPEPDWSYREDEAVTPRQTRGQARRQTERGVPGIVGLLILLVVCGIGGAIDLTNGSSVKGGFNIALIVGAVLAALAVRRSSLFPVVVAPPIVYFGASAVLLYFRSNGFKDRGALLDAGVNWLVYGFPAIAGATAAVLIIAGVRMITGK